MIEIHYSALEMRTFHIISLVFLVFCSALAAGNANGQEKKVEKSDANDAFGNCTRKDISLTQKTLIVSEEILSCGGNIEIFADKIEFRGGGRLNSGVTGRPTASCSRVPRGGDSGDINIVAREIFGMNISSKGGPGANARTGCPSCPPGRLCTPSHRYGGYGGDAGNVTIRWHDADPSLGLDTDNPRNIDMRGGEPGRGAGNEPDGEPGSSGEYGRSRFSSKTEFYQLALVRIPSLAEGLVQEAELLFLAQDTERAKSLLQLVTRHTLHANSFTNAVKNRAEFLLDRINNGQNVFGFSKTWARKFYNDLNRVRNIDDLSRLVDGMTLDLSLAENNLQYRELLKHDAEKAEESKNFEINALNQEIQNSKFEESKALQAIDDLKSKITRAEDHVVALRDRLKRITDEITNLPQRAARIISRINNGFNKILGGITKIIGVFSIGFDDIIDFLNGVSQVVDGVASTAESFLELKSILTDLGSQFDEIQDKLFSIKEDISRDENEIKELKTQLDKINSIEENNILRIKYLNNNWSSRNTEELERLYEVAKDVHFQLRLEMAKNLYGFWRSADFLLDHKHDLSFAGAPGGVDKTMSLNHLLLLKQQFERKVRWGRPRYDEIPAKVCLNMSEFPEEKKLITSGKYGAFLFFRENCLKNNSFYKNARIMSFAIDMFDKEGQSIQQQGRLFYFNTGTRLVGNGESVIFDIEPSHPRFVTGTLVGRKSHGLEWDHLEGLYSIGNFRSGNNIKNLDKILIDLELLIPADSGLSKPKNDERLKLFSNMLKYCAATCG